MNDILTIVTAFSLAHRQKPSPDYNTSKIKHLEFSQKPNGHITLIQFSLQKDSLNFEYFRYYQNKAKIT